MLGFAGVIEIEFNVGFEAGFESITRLEPQPVPPIKTSNDAKQNAPMNLDTSPRARIDNPQLDKDSLPGHTSTLRLRYIRSAPGTVPNRGEPYLAAWLNGTEPKIAVMTRWSQMPRKKNPDGTPQSY